MKAAGVDTTVQAELLGKVSVLLNEANIALAKLRTASDEAAAIESAKEKAFYYRNNVTDAMVALRTPCDELEKIVDKEFWPIPTYSDLMFEV